MAVSRESDMRDRHSTLIKPVVTEKAMDLGSKRNTYTFIVLKDANKLEIRHAVEKNFNVKVARVNTATVKGKQRRFRFAMGRKPDWKKAFVTLKEGYILNII